MDPLQTFFTLNCVKDTFFLTKFAWVIFTHIDGSDIEYHFHYHFIAKSTQASISENKQLKIFRSFTEKTLFL